MNLYVSAGVKAWFVLVAGLTTGDVTHTDAGVLETVAFGAHCLSSTIVPSGSLKPQVTTYLQSVVAPGTRCLSSTIVPSGSLKPQVTTYLQLFIAIYHNIIQ